MAIRYGRTTFLTLLLALVSGAPVLACGQQLSDSADGRIKLEALIQRAARQRLRGDYRSSVHLLTYAVSIAEHDYGPNHPMVARSLGLLAEARWLAGDLKGAGMDAFQQLDVLRAAYHNDLQHLTEPFTMIGLLILAKDVDEDLWQADGLLRIALKLKEESSPPTDPGIARALRNVALVHLTRREYNKAIPLLLRARTIYARKQPPNPDDATEAEINFADALAGLGQDARADKVYGSAATRILRVNGPNHPLLARILLMRATLRVRNARSDSVEAWLQRALALQRLRPASEHPNIPGVLTMLGALYSRRGELARADSVLSAGLKMVELRRGANDDRLSALLNELSGVQEARNDLEGAEASLSRVLEIDARTVPGSPAHAAAINNLAILEVRRGRYAKADSLFNQALPIFMQAYGTKHPEVARVRLNRAGLDVLMGRFTEAAQDAGAALTTYRISYGTDDLNTADALATLAGIDQETGDYYGADSLSQSVLAIRRRIEGEWHPDVALALNNRAVAVQSLGRYVAADSLLRQSLAIRERVFGAGHPLVSATLASLAQNSAERGDYPAADSLFRKALLIDEHALGTFHPDVSTALSGLGGFYMDRGDSFRAIPLLERALDIDRRVLGEMHPRTALTMQNLAVAYKRMSDTARSESLLDRAGDIFLATVGPSVWYAINRGNLGKLYLDRGQVARALPFLEESLRLSRQLLGESHPNTAEALTDVAKVYRRSGRLDDAEAASRRAVQIEEASLGEQHPKFADALQELSVVLYARGRKEEAIRLFARAQASREHGLRSILTIGSEAQKTQYLASISSDVATLISVDAEQHSRASVELALTTVLRRKGRALDAVADQTVRLRRDLDTPGKALLDSLALLRAQLGHLSAVPQADTALVRSLETTSDQLEQTISARSAAFREATRPVDLAGVRAALPLGSALIEFVRYVPVDVAATQQRPRERPARYYAFVLRPSGGAPRSIDLGTATEIDSAITHFLDALGTPFSTNVAEVGRRLETLVMTPIQRLLGNEKTLFVSPDGPLNIVPFGALTDETGRFLVDRWRFVYLTSGRDLMRLAEAPPASPGTAVVVGDPDYGVYVPMQGARRWPRLEGTGLEARSVGRHLSGALVLTDGQATESRLKQLAHPLVLHLATHGYYEDSLATRMTNPLLHTGLALAGANSGGSNGEDGVLTALEAAALDLNGTALVVLSACESGTGVVSSGEGVYGLRRALLLAGARAEVMSLWQVNDRATLQLMDHFYSGLAAGWDPTEALRQAQLALRSSVRWQHPYYWAAFVAAGDWRPLPREAVR